MDAVLNSSVKMDWQTPDSLLELVRQVGPIALDPCTVGDNPTGARRYCSPDAVSICSVDAVFGEQLVFGCLSRDGLAEPWNVWTDGHGLAFVNPPYGRELPKWVRKCQAEAALGAEIILLTPARPDTHWFQNAANELHHADSTRGAAVVLFWRGRLKFVEPGAPSPELHWKKERTDKKTGCVVPAGWGQADPCAFPSALWCWGSEATQERFRRVFANRGLFL